MSLLERHAVETTGMGERTLVLLHGYGCDKRMWDGIVPLLRDDHRIVLYDLMGYGASEGGGYDRDRYATLDGHADDLRSVLDALDLRDVTVIGHSVSAMTAALAANADAAEGGVGRIRDVVMICPSPSFIDDGTYRGGFARSDIAELLETLDANYLGWSRAMAPAIMGTPDAPAHAARLTDSFCQADPDVARHFARVTFLFDHRADVARVAQRTALLQCRNDVIVPDAVGPWMVEAMLDAELTVLDATGHCPHVSAPQETAAAIRAFLGPPTEPATHAA